MSYGKHFASMYSGSLFGQPAIVFAVWGYVIANMRPERREGGRCYVELNPALLAATFATAPAEVLRAIETLESPDPESRTADEEGRRLMCLGSSRHAGPMQFLVVNGAKYRATRDEERRREQNREAQRRFKSKRRSAKVSQGKPESAQAEAEAEKSSLSGSQAIADDIALVRDGYNAIAERWGKSKITDRRIANLTKRIRAFATAMSRAHPADFTFPEFLRRLEQQSAFFCDKWQAWDLEWFLKTSNGEFSNGEKTFALSYRQQGESPTTRPDGFRGAATPVVTELAEYLARGAK